MTRRQGVGTAGAGARAAAAMRLAAAVAVLLFATPATVASGAIAPPAPVDFITRDGTQLELRGDPYRFTGINIYNANNSSGCWYPMASGSVLDDAIVELGGGGKVIRAWFFQALATSGGARDWSGFDHTLSVAAARSKRVIVTLGNQWADCDGPNGGAGSFKDEAWYTTGYTQPDPGGTVSYRDYVAEIVTRYRDNPTILAWQLMNEAEVKPSETSTVCSTNAAQILKSFATDVSGLIKSIDPNHLVSLGTIGGGQCGAQGAEYQDVHDVATIDLCEYHDYGSPNTPMPGDQWNGLQVRLDQCNALNKPLFVGETGIRPQDVDGTLAGRAAAFDAKFDAQLAAGVVGQLVWAWNASGSLLDNFDIGPDDPVIAVLQAWHESLGPNHAPDANNEPLVPLTANVLANDRDVDGDPLTLTSYTLVNDSGRVSLTCELDGTCTWTPLFDPCVAPLQPGEGSWTYTISDGRGGTDTATAGVIYAYVCDPPVGADMSVVKTDSADPATAGAQLTYTLTVDNVGTADATGVVVTDTLPAGVAFVSASDGGTEAGGVVTWNLGTVAPSDPPRQLTVTVAVSIVQAADLVNAAQVSTSSADANTANDTDGETTAVATPGLPAITVTPSSLSAGGGVVAVSGTGFTPGPPLSGLGEIFIKRCSGPGTPGFPAGLCEGVRLPNNQSINANPLSVVNDAGEFGPILVLVPATFPGLGFGGTDLPCDPCTIVVENPTATGQQIVSAPITFDAQPDAFPVCEDESVQTPMGTPVGIQVDCSDADDDPLSYTVVSGPSFGTVSGTGSNLLYTPTGDDVTDSFVVTVTDGRGGYDNVFVTVAVGQSPEPHVVRGFKLNDLDNDNQVDPGEPRVSDWPIRLYVNADGDQELDPDELASAIETTTDASGNYTFSLQPGHYLICEPRQPGWEQGPSDPPSIWGGATVCAADPDLYPAGYTITVGGGQPTRQFGFANHQATPPQPHVVRGFKLNDLDNDNQVDPGEPRVSDWPIRLYVNADGDQELDPDELASAIETTTDASGNYTFSLQPGHYLICEPRQPGWEQGPSDPPSIWGGPTVCAEDPDLYPAGYTITVGGGQPTRQFGFANHQPTPPQPHLVSGFKFNSLDQDNEVDTGEPRVPDWTIKLYVNADGDQELDADEIASAIETLTNANGDYSFSLQPGRYILCEARQDSWEQTPSDPPSIWGGPTVCQADASVYPAGYTITVGGGQPTRQFGFGNYQPTPPAADLSITKADSVDPVAAGSQLTYTLTVDNTGPADAADVVVSDTLPDGVSFVSATDGGTESGGVVTWNLGTIPAADPPRELTLVVDVVAGQTADLVNTAAISSATPDASPGNDQASEPTSIENQPPLVALAAGPASGSAPLDVQLDVSGSDVDGQVVGWVLDFGDGTAPVSNDETNEGFSESIQHTYAAPGTYTAALTATDDDGAQSTVEVTIEVTAPPTADLSITKADSVDPVQAGSQLTYTLTVDNAGPDDAADVVVTDTLPAGVSFVSASDGGTESGGVVTWNLGTVPVADPPRQLTLVVEVAADRTGDLVNEGAIVTSTTDPGAGNNATSVTTSVQSSVVYPSLDPQAPPKDTTWAWGEGDNGRLGAGNTRDRALVGEVQDAQDFVAIGSGANHSLAVDTDGTVWTWGSNQFGKLGDGSTTDRLAPVPIDPESGLTNATSAAGGDTHSVALRADGTVWTWGYNHLGQLGDDQLGISGRMTPGQVPGLTNVTMVAAGAYHNLALRNGTVWAWGHNGTGQLGDGTTSNRFTPAQVPGLANVIAVSAGHNHSLALRADGTVWAWGANHVGQLGDGTTAFRATPVQMLTDVVSVSAGTVGHHNLALRSDGTVWAWGWNEFGQIDGSPGNRLAPVQVPSLTDVTAVSGGAYHSLALRTDGTVVAWGDNGSGQLGDGTFVSRSTPSQVPGLTNVTDVVGGALHTLAIGRASSTLGVESFSIDVPAGVSVTTDVELDGATSDDAIETTLRTPNSGTVSVVEEAASTSAGFSIAGRSVRINAPAASIADPLLLTFQLDASLYPVAWPIDSLAVSRNGSPVGPCVGPNATPNPCVASRTRLPDGDVEVVVRTSAASDWLVGRVGPHASAGGPYTVSEGSSVPLAASATGGESPYAYLWAGPEMDMDDPLSSTPTYTGHDDGVVPLWLRVTDAAGLSGTGSSTVTVSNADPIVQPPSPTAPVMLGEQLTLEAAFVDPGTADEHTAVVDWGDGTAAALSVSELDGAGSASGAHTYASAGAWTVTVTVTDDDGGTGEVSAQVVVSEADPCAGPAPPGAIVGGAGNNTLNGTAGNDFIFDSGGTNTINGKGGNDTICTGAGNDKIDGGDGDDVIVDAGGVNTVNGGAGRDLVTTRSGNDKVEGGSGNDALTDEGGVNTVNGGAGSDAISTGPGNDKVDGGGDGDTIVDTGGANTIAGAAGADTITAGAGADKVDGGAENDTIDAGGGNNTVTGAGGNDVIAAGAGNDTIDGGAGNDTVQAGDGANNVKGSGGDDHITTGSGNDTIDGGAGFDTCLPGDGVNTVRNCEA